jgi:type VI protein secretion system component Hcp
MISDSTSMKLLHALMTNEVVKSVIFEFYGSGTGGSEKVVQRIALTNTLISNIQRFTPSHRKRHERVTLIYQELAVSGSRGGVIPYSLMG